MPFQRCIIRPGALGGFRIRAILSRNKIISITHPPRQLRTWEYYRQNRTIKLHFMRRQWRALEYFPKIWDFIPPQTGLLRSMLRPLNLGPGGRSYNKPISCLHWGNKWQQWGKGDWNQWLRSGESHNCEPFLSCLFMGGVGGKMVQYVTCLNRPVSTLKT